MTNNVKPDQLFNSIDTRFRTGNGKTYRRTFLPENIVIRQNNSIFNTSGFPPPKNTGILRKKTGTCRTAGNPSSTKGLKTGWTNTGRLKSLWTHASGAGPVRTNAISISARATPKTCRYCGRNCCDPSIKMILPLLEKFWGPLQAQEN